MRVVCLLLLSVAVVGFSQPDRAREVAVVDETGAVTAEQSERLREAAQALQDECDITLVPALLPELPREEVSRRKDAILAKLKADGAIRPGAVALFVFSGEASLSWVSTPQFDERVPTEQVQAAWQAAQGDLPLADRVVKFLESLRASTGPGPTPGEQPGTDGAPPAVPEQPAVFPTAPMARVELRPSDAPQTVSARDGVRVTVPGGVLNEPTDLTIAAVTELPPEARGGFEALGTYEVSLGDLHEFDRDILVEVPYDPALMETDQALADQILALRWDTDRHCWVEVPFSVDPATRRVIARTRHLSVLSFIYRVEVALYNGLYEQFAYTVIRVRNFRFYYDVPSLQTNKTVQRWKPETSPETAFQHLYDYDNPSWLPFVRDLSYYLEKANKAYTGLPLSPLGKLPVVVKIGPDVAGTDPACYDYTTNRLYVSSNRVSSRADLKHKLAHELFHAMQASHLAYDGSLAVSATAKWWMEASAEYASCRVPWELDLMGGSVHSIYPYLLEYPLTQTGNPSDGHKVTGFNELEYDRGYLLDYLVRHCGANFGGMFKAASKALVDSKAWSYTSPAGGPVLAAVQGHLLAQGKRTLPEAYRGFVPWFLFSEEAPLARSTTSEPTECMDNPGRALVVFPPVTRDPETGAGRYYKQSHTMDLPGGYTARVYAVKLEHAANDTAPRPMVVRAPTLPPNAVLDVYTIPEGQRVAGQPEPAARIGADNRPVLVDVPAGHVLYIVAANLSVDEAQKVEFEVEDYRLTLQITIDGESVISQ